MINRGVDIIFLSKKSMEKLALVTDGVNDLIIQGLENLGYTCHYRPEITLAEVHTIIHQYEGLIINSKILVDKAMLDKAVKLKFIGRLGSGMEIIDQVYAKEKGVAVYSAPEGNKNAVAEHAVGMLLALMNKFRQADAQVRRKYWNREENRGIEIEGKTVGIIGFGHTGRQFAKKLAGFDVKVLAYDKYKTNYVQDSHYISESNMETIFEEADIVSFHLPLTEETTHLVTTSFIQKFAKRIWIINTSRGKVIDTTSLITGLEDGKILGAAIDVFENEKPATFTKEEDELYGKLYEFENVILTPHVAGWTVESKRKLADVLLKKITGNW